MTDAAHDSLRRTPISPWAHTALLAGLFLWLAISGAFFRRQAEPPPSLQTHAMAVYLSIIAMQWILFLAVWQGGLRRRGASLADLIGGHWNSAAAVLTDCALAIGTWVAMGLVRMASVTLFGASQGAAVQGLMPRTPAELLLWIAVSISAGFCEELVFRGYFQRQFEVLTRSRWIALTLQAVLFGVSHGYQGVEACVRITVIGALFGLLAIWRRSLRSGMLAHALSDILGGIGI